MLLCSQLGRSNYEILFVAAALVALEKNVETHIRRLTLRLAVLVRKPFH